MAQTTTTPARRPTRAEQLAAEQANESAADEKYRLAEQQQLADRAGR